jgi:hypothetical protein
MILPNEAQPLLFDLTPAFTTPTFQRFTTLMVAAILRASGQNYLSGGRKPPETSGTQGA